MNKDGDAFWTGWANLKPTDKIAVGNEREI